MPDLIVAVLLAGWLLGILSALIIVRLVANDGRFRSPHKTEELKDDVYDSIAPSAVSQRREDCANCAG